MLVRTLFAAVNLGVLTATLAIWFALPHDASYALYGCLAWVAAAFVVMYSPWGNRPLRLGVATSAPASARAPGAPAGAAGRIDFCIYCAAPIAAGAARCSACGHATPSP